MQKYTAREKFLVSNTLNCIPVILQGRAVLIDLHNETSVAGTIDISDGHMNIELRQAVFIDRIGQQYPFENFMVRNRMIRQLHIPNEIDIERVLRETMDRGILRPKRVNKVKSKRTFKQKRAEERHKETLAHISQQKQSEPKQHASS